MSIKQLSDVPSPVPAGDPLSIKEITALLIRHYGVHEGLFDLYLEYRMAFGAFGPTPEEVLPSTILGVSNLSITKSEKLGPLTVDAALVNPKSSSPRTKKPISSRKSSA